VITPVSLRYLWEVREGRRHTAERISNHCVVPANKEEESGIGALSGDAMRCDAMRCDAMRCDAMRCDAMRCDAMRCDAMRCEAMRCDVMRCDAMRCDAMRCDAMRCDAMVREQEQRARSSARAAAANQRPSPLAQPLPHPALINPWLQLLDDSHRHVDRAPIESTVDHERISASLPLLLKSSRQWAASLQ